MKRFSLYGVVAAAFLVLAATVVNGQPQRRMVSGDAQGRMGMGMRLGEELNLTEEQKNQVHQIFLDARKKNIDVDAKQKLGRLELAELLNADAPDQKKIDAQIAELGQLHAAKMSSHINSVLAVQKTLTPEQRKKAKELRLFGGFGLHGFGDGPMMHHGQDGFGGPGRLRQMHDDEEDL